MSGAELAARVRSRRAIATGSTAVSRKTLGVAARHVFALLALAVTLTFTGLYVYGQLEIGLFFDLEGTILRPAHAVLAGANPYPAPSFAAVDIGNPAVYPPLSFLLALPLALLPHQVAGLIWTIALGACAAGTLGVMGVRDWRAYALALSSYPVVHGVVFGNLTIVLVLGVALAWRLRSRPVWLGIVVGLVVALKLFLWPLMMWLLVTRRLRSLAAAFAASATAVLGGWAVIGFAGLAEYPHLLRTLTDVFAGHSMSLFAAMTASTDIPGLFVQAFLVAAALGICCAAYLGGASGRDPRALAAAVAAAVVASPIVWPHYYALLIVLLPLIGGWSSAAWLVLPATWVAAFLLPYDAADESPCCRPDHVPEELWSGLHGPPFVWQSIAYVLLTAIVVVALIRRAGTAGPRGPTVAPDRRPLTVGPATGR